MQESFTETEFLMKHTTRTSDDSYTKVYDPQRGDTNNLVIQFHVYKRSELSSVQCIGESYSVFDYMRRPRDVRSMPKYPNRFGFARKPVD